MTEDVQFTKLTVDLLMVAKGFCEYGDEKGLLTADGLRFAITRRREVARQLANAGKSQREIAVLLGVSQATVGYDLNGRTQSVQNRTQSVQPPEEVDEIDDEANEDDGDEDSKLSDEADADEEDGEDIRLTLINRCKMISQIAEAQILSDFSTIDIDSKLMMAVNQVVTAWKKLAAHLEELKQ